jgi:hypothetical protein
MQRNPLQPSRGPTTAPDQPKQAILEFVNPYALCRADQLTCVKPAGAVPQTAFSSRPSGATLAHKDAAYPANEHAGRNP